MAEAITAAMIVGWSKRLQTMAQTGLTYARDPYDRERYEAIQEMAFAMMAGLGGINIEVVREFFAGEGGHATPKIDVRAAIFRDGRILLVRERRDGLWTLPGGWADVGETPSEAVAREVLEESGMTVQVTRLLALFDKRAHQHPPQPFYVYKLFFEAEVVAEGKLDNAETDALGWFALTGLPPLSLDRVLPSQVARLFALHADPAEPTAFD